MNFTKNDWGRLLCELGVRPLTAAKWTPAFFIEIQPENFSKGMDDILDFLPQILHECNLLENTEENLNYSAQRLTEVWPARFPTLASAEPFARNAPKLANKVYGDRMGNYAENDGWEFRGRSPIMLTGRDGYRLVGNLMGQDLETIPHLIEGPIYGLNAAVAWWEGRVPDAYLGDQVKLRRRVNGGAIGLAHVQKLADLTRKVFA